VSIEPGALHVVATPIGHLDDWSPRAQAVVAAADRVAAEDTRHTGRLLARFGIRADLVSLNEHNEERRVPDLLDRLHAGAIVALLSDAGTPTISDPGYRLVCAAHAAGVRVLAVPGPSAVMAALAVAGQPTDRFAFEGFLPPRRAARRERLAALAVRAETLVLFESCHRIRACLADLAAAFGGERPATLARELTKQFETVRRGTLGELVEFVDADPDQRRGEIVLVVAGCPDGPGRGRSLDLGTVLEALLPELAPGRAAAVAARLTGDSRQAAYAEALKRSGKQ